MSATIVMIASGLQEQEPEKFPGFQLFNPSLDIPTLIEAVDLSE
jgi:hypothetical protein